MLVSVLAMPGVSRMRPRAASNASRLSARTSATMSQRPLVVCSVPTVGSPGARITAGRRCPPPQCSSRRGCAGARVRPQAHGVAGDDAALFHFVQAVLHRTARHAQLLRQRGDQGAGVGAQDADDFAVGVVKLGHGDGALADRQFLRILVAGPYPTLRRPLALPGTAPSGIATGLYQRVTGRFGNKMPGSASYICLTAIKSG